MSVTKLPDPLPKVHQCGCGSQAFHLCADGRVVCLQCRYIIEPLRVVPEPPQQAAPAEKPSAKIELWEADEYVLTITGHGVVGPTFHKRDAEIVKRWLDCGGLSVLSAHPSSLPERIRKLAENWRKELREVDSDRDNYGPPSADKFAAELLALLDQEGD